MRRNLSITAARTEKTRHFSCISCFRLTIMQGLEEEVLLLLNLTAYFEKKNTNRLAFTHKFFFSFEIKAAIVSSR